LIFLWRYTGDDIILEIRIDMKAKKIFLIAIIAFICYSCHYDSAYHEEYFVVNKMPKSLRIVCSVRGLLDTLDLQPECEVLIKDWYDASYSDAGTTLSVWAMRDEFICFNDSVVLKYSDLSASFFEKSLWKKECWEVLEYNGKPRNTYYKLRYAIDEQDYQNALHQCGYDLEE